MELGEVLAPARTSSLQKVLDAETESGRDWDSAVDTLNGACAEAGLAKEFFCGT